MSNLQAIQNFPVNPISGTYGSGKIQLFSASGTFTRPTGVTNVRARCFGGGGDTNGGGGGFAIKEIIGVAATVTVTVGAASGTSSFGALVSATGGTSGSGGAGGAGSGGDYNSTGGLASTSTGGGGGVASIWGDGGAGTNAGTRSGASGGGGSVNQPGSAGLFGASSQCVLTQGTFSSGSAISWNSIDMIGTGGGGGGGDRTSTGQNGGGSGGGYGGYPGGGGNGGARGLVIVEY